jgi:hypothetical protein
MQMILKQFKIGCRGWNRTSICAFKGRCPTIRRPGNCEIGTARLRAKRYGTANFVRYDATNKIWWPARVTRPVLRVKSPLHHFNACRPNTVVLTVRVALTLATLSTSCLFWLGYMSTRARDTHLRLVSFTNWYCENSWSQYSPSHDRGRSSYFALGGVKMAGWAITTAKAGAPGQSCTDIMRGLSPLPLHWTTGVAGAGSDGRCSPIANMNPGLSLPTTGR